MFAASVTSLRLAFGSALLAAAFLMAPAMGQAASISRITFDVTGGTFGLFTTATGAITSGTVAFKSVSPSGVSTPQSNFGGSPVWSLSKLTLVGPSGYFKVLSGAAFAVQSSFVRPATRFWFGKGTVSAKTGPSPAAAFSGLTYMFGKVRYVTVTTRPIAIGTVNIAAAGGAHTFTLGNEVQTMTTIPEPGAGLLLAFGLTGLATAVRLRRRRL